MLMEQTALLKAALMENDSDIGAFKISLLHENT